ncbi:MAG: alanine--tRNA ligase [Candidatus Heimdallarchaeum aukensis]|uniref:Alanine--tRNA ligase n=1 Tax=Candidatus Heimdallarchaeum aukensis TaxID=2876573 RepID=A0A9Y1BMW9_9ARCH|nr:MAG: alanine--tRNA ligase [Candidatus Heimdallarchaeum aukensis]
MTLSKDELRKRFSAKDYEVELFREEGFIRKQCPKCGHFYWTVNPEQETCGDTICHGGYKFLDKKGKNLDFDETIKSLTNFFVKHGHTAIKDYPVVARWRADMEFTIASIADFQPWVLNGIIPPPANPLVVPQFCIRTGGEFSDIDNIGKTARHLTSFVMFGQHSFNSKELTDGYWMDRCIELNFKYLTEELGLKKEEISYSEGIWAGGGNFGPNLEAFAYGSELVNNVFIAYGFENGTVKKLDMQVIDVGWGLERVSWFTQGTPTIYEAIFPKAIEYLQKENGYKADHELLVKYSKLAGMLAVDEVKNLKMARREMAKKLGLSYEEMLEKLGPQEAMYAIADHTRTLSIAIADGAIPSNVGGGYNLRVLLRRILSLKEIYNLEFSLDKLFDLQIDHLSVSYPRVKEGRNQIQEIVNVEVSRFYETRKAGRKIVSNILKKKTKIGFNTLVDLYQTKGINPLMVKEIAKEYNKTVDVPDDFYIKLNEYLSEKNGNGIKEEKKEDEYDKLSIDRTLYTEQTYYKDVYAYKFKAKVLDVINKRYVILDKTLFYPTGGGQIHDTGKLIVGKKQYNVIDVVKKGQAIIHKLETESDLKKGITVVGEIDRERRLDIMRHHTAVHVVNNAAREVLGSHVWQAGADKTEDKARLDITHYKSISFEELQKIEYIANEIVLEKRPIKKIDLERDEAEKKFGFTIYQGGVVPGKELHIVIIDDWDVEACGGTHLDNTADIGLIKLVGSERIQDGVVRLEIVAGRKAVKYVQKQETILRKSGEILSVNPDILPKTIKRFFEEWKKQRKTIENLNKKIAELQFSHEKEDVLRFGDTIVVVQKTEGNQKELILQASEAIKNKEKAVCILFSDFKGKAIIVGMKSPNTQIDIVKIVKDISEMLGGSGGGKGELARGGGSKAEMISEAIEKTKQLLEKELGGK